MIIIFQFYSDNCREVKSKEWQIVLCGLLVKLLMRPNERMNTKIEKTLWQVVWRGYCDNPISILFRVCSTWMENKPSSISHSDRIQFHFPLAAAAAATDKIYSARKWIVYPNDYYTHLMVVGNIICQVTVKDEDVFGGRWVGSKSRSHVVQVEFL